MPPTTGGNTSGNRIIGRSSRVIRPGPRANTTASGTPNNRHSAVLARQVLTLSNSAARDAGPVTSAGNCPQSAFTTSASSGSTMSTAPMAAGT
ncbi:Uncharacterised protein [Mycobacteroides abscessus]|nr:Uncharacterised protein [Mycobacteroides abscessus]